MPVTTSRQARHFPQAARKRLLCDAQSLRCRQRQGAAAYGLQGARLDQRRFCMDDRQGRQSRHPGGCLAHLAALCAAVDLPVNADFEGGFAHEPEKVAANVARAVKSGVAGLSIEDSTGEAAKPLYERSEAIARIKAARGAIDADNSGVLLTGRCEGFLVGRSRSRHGDRSPHCLLGRRRRLPVCAGHPHPGTDRSGRQGGASEAGQSPAWVAGLSVAEATELGVRRISIGGSLARAAWGGFMRAAREIAEKGTFNEFGNAHPGGELNKMFS